MLEIELARAPPGLHVNLACAQLERLARQLRQRRQGAGYSGGLKQHRVGRDAMKASGGSHSAQAERSAVSSMRRRPGAWAGEFVEAIAELDVGAGPSQCGSLRAVARLGESRRRLEHALHERSVEVFRQGVELAVRHLQDEAVGVAIGFA